MKLFYCYSNNLKEFLVAKGVNYLHKSKHFKTHRNFWVFEGTEKLNDLLETWKKRKI